MGVWKRHSAFCSQINVNNLVLMCPLIIKFSFFIRLTGIPVGITSIFVVGQLLAKHGLLFIALNFYLLCRRKDKLSQLIHICKGFSHIYSLKIFYLQFDT